MQLFGIDSEAVDEYWKEKEEDLIRSSRFFDCFFIILEVIKAKTINYPRIFEKFN